MNLSHARREVSRAREHVRELAGTFRGSAADFMRVHKEALVELTIAQTVVQAALGYYRDYEAKR